MPARRLSDIAVIVIAGVAITLLAGAAAIVSPPPLPGDERGSSFSTGKEGAKAAFLMLKQIGYETERSLEPITALSVDPSETALVLASPSGEPSDLDRKALQEFLDDGGLVLATGAGGADFLAAAPKAAARLPPELAPRTYMAALPSPLTVGAPQIVMAREIERPWLDPSYVAIYGSESDGVVRAAYVGEGRAIWWAGSTPLTNAAIADPGHAELLLNALGPPGERRVLWDEQYHGHARSLWSYVARTPLAWIVLQIGLIGVAALLTYSRHGGLVRSKVVDPRTSPMEFVDTMGGLYAQAGAAAAAVTAAATRLRRRLVVVTGLPPDTPDAALAFAAAARSGIDAGKLTALLAEARPGDPDRDRAVALVRQLQEMSAALGGVRPVRRDRA